jgi:hypothetical protein
MKSLKFYLTTAFMVTIMTYAVSASAQYGDYYGDFFNWTLSDDLENQTDFTAEKELVQIISEPEDNKVHKFIINLDDAGNFRGLIRRSTTDEATFSTTDFFNKEVVVAKASDRDAVLLSCQNCTESAGGTLRMRYLYNGLTGSFNVFDMKIVRENNNWILYANDDSGEVKVHTLRLRSRKLGDILIGIRKIEVNR